MQIFVSGTMVTHELDADRETARHAITALAPMFTAFAYRPFVSKEDIPSEPAARDATRLILQRCQGFVLLVGRSISSFCSWELHWAKTLGLPCRAFLCGEVRQDPRVMEVLTKHGCEYEYYDSHALGLAEVVQEFCRSLLIASEEKHAVVIHTVNVWKGIVGELARSPERVFSLSPRKFEELLAELIASHGYTTTLTPQTRDGGFDIIARRNEGLFPSLYLVEAKLWAPPSRVGRPVIQALYGTGMSENCNGVMIVTPAAFTRDALSYVQDKQLQEFVRLVDGSSLPDWYEQYLKGPKSTS